MKDRRVVNVMCAPHCSQYPCMMQATVEDGKVIGLAPHPKNLKYPPCAKGWSMLWKLYHPDRLKYPLKRVGERGEGKWERTSWDEALGTIVAKLSDIKAKYGNEAIVFYNYVGCHDYPNGAVIMKYTAWRLFFLWGGCIAAHARGNHCFWAFLKACSFMYGSRNFALPTYDECDVILLWGTNPAETQVRGTIQALLAAKQRGCKFAVIDPAYTTTAARLADWYLPIRPGTDTALALAITNVVVRENLYNEDFLLCRTNAPYLVRDDNGLLLRDSDLSPTGTDAPMVLDSVSGEPRVADSIGVVPRLAGSCQFGNTGARTAWERIVENVAEWTPEKAAAVTGLSAEDILTVARAFGKAKKAKAEVFSMAAMNRSSWGENAFLAVGALNVITGNFDGILSMMNPKLPGVDLGIEAAIASFETPNPVKNSFPVNHLGEAILNPSRYGTNIKAVFSMCGNPVTQNTNSNKTIKALRQLEFVCVTDTFMTDTAKYADIVLPSNTFLERSAIYEGADIASIRFLYFYKDPSVTRRIYRSQKAVDSLYESKSDFQIICELAKRMGLAAEFPWKDEDEWIEDILDIGRKDARFPWLKSMSSQELIDQGIVDVEASSIRPHWQLSTPSGKIELYSEVLLKQGFDPLPIYREPEESPISTPELFAKYPLSLISAHSTARVHSSYIKIPELNDLSPQTVQIHPTDAASRSIKDGENVDVFNDLGRISLRAEVVSTIREGVVRISGGGWQEQGSASVLISDRLTPIAENSIFNTSLVEVQKKGRVASMA